VTTLLTNIASLVNVREESHLLRGKELSELPCINNAYLVVEDDEIAAYGSMQDFFLQPADFQFHFNLAGRYVLPSWCDSHSHLVFAGSREDEFIDKIKGATYKEIAANGGGILNSARKIQSISEDELFVQSYKRLQEVASLGTGAIEIKSGYGLCIEGELKMLRVIKRLKEQSRVFIKSTFLGAHAFPLEYQNNQEEYIDSIISEMLPVVAKENLADYIDVFCEEGFFSPVQAEKICRAGMEYGLRAKIHANQLTASGAVQLGVKLNALSVDHLEIMDDAAIEALSNSTTIGTILPTAAFFLRMPYQAARKLIDANCAIALASDFNPGSSPSGNMNFVVALSCIQLRLFPSEAINAATINGAFAMGVQNKAGSITKGKKANLIITKPMPSINYLPYAFGSNNIEKVMLGGEWL
jgi:imidazolonepropionase